MHIVADLITKLGSAIEQLEWAIVLLVEHDAAIPAITLAAASEEILGRAPGVVPALYELRDTLAPEMGLSPKAVVDDHLNYVRNWLKHWKQGEDPELILDDLQAAAILYILRALSNLEGAGAPRLERGERFAAWVRQHRPDIWD